MTFVTATVLGGIIRTRKAHRALSHPAGQDIIPPKATLQKYPTKNGTMSARWRRRRCHGQFHYYCEAQVLFASSQVRFMNHDQNRSPTVKHNGRKSPTSHTPFYSLNASLETYNCGPNPIPRHSMHLSYKVQPASCGERNISTDPVTK